MQLAEAENKITNYKIALGLSLLLGTIIFALVIVTKSIEKYSIT